MNKIAAGALYDAVEMTDVSINKNRDLRETAAARANDAHQRIEKLLVQREKLLDGLEEMTGNRDWEPE